MQVGPKPKQNWLIFMGNLPSKNDLVNIHSNVIRVSMALLLESEGGSYQVTLTSKTPEATVTKCVKNRRGG